MLKLLFIVITIVTFQSDQSPITPDNLGQLRSAVHIDFADLPDDIGTVNSGWFTMSPDGAHMAVVRQDGGLVIWDETGALVDTFVLTGADNLPATVLDARFDETGERTASIHTADGQTYSIYVHTIGGDGITLDYPTGEGVPTRVWLDAETPHVWVESAPDPFDPANSSHQVMRLPLPETEDQDLLLLPSGPEQDEDSFVRIGRIPAPLAITSTADGLVRLWDLQLAEITAEVQLDDVPVFGRINETTGTQLVWRDQISQALHLLDFTSGENRRIADIGGAYIQAILPTPGAELILAVHIGDDPVVAAWEIDSGERIDLGPYREDCSRVPDMVQLSHDGTDLVIGCDAGLDIWRVVEEE